MVPGSVLTQDFFDSSSVNGNIALTYLAIELVTIPFWVHVSGNKGPSPGPPLEMVLSHDSTKSLYCLPWFLDLRFSSGFCFLFVSVFDRFLLQLSEGLSGRTTVNSQKCSGPLVCSTAPRNGGTGNVDSRSSASGIFAGPVRSPKVFSAG